MIGFGMSNFALTILPLFNYFLDLMCGCYPKAFRIAIQNNDLQIEPKQCKVLQSVQFLIMLLLLFCHCRPSFEELYHCQGLIGIASEWNWWCWQYLLWMDTKMWFTTNLTSLRWHYFLNLFIIVRHYPFIIHALQTMNTALKCAIIHYRRVNNLLRMFSVLFLLHLLQNLIIKAGIGFKRDDLKKEA